MREKRGVKATTVNCSEISIIAREETPVVNGVHLKQSSEKSVVISQSISNSEFAKRCGAMDYEKYLICRNNGSANEHDLMNSSGRTTIPSFDSISTPNSEDSSQDDCNTPPGHVFKFYRQFAADYWNWFPKTDYTYSPSSHFYKKEIVPGIPVVPNLSRRPCRLSYGTPSTPTLSPPKNSEERAEHGRSSPISTGNSIIRRRNATVYRQNNWIKNSWIKRTFETVKTVIITTITTSVTTTTEAVMHPMRKPCITFPILFLLLALLFYILFFTESEMAEKETEPWRPLAWVQTHTINTSSLAAFGSVMTKPFIWAYKVGNACLQLLATCLFMIPTILSQLAQSLNTCFLIFFQRIAGWASQGPAVGALDGDSGILKSADKSPAIDSEEIRRIVLQVLSEREQKDSNDLHGMKVPPNEQVVALNEFILKVNEKLATLENLSNDQKKALEDIYPQLKLLEEKLSFSQLNSGQSAEVASRDGTSNVTIVGWPELSENVMHVVKTMIKQYHADRTGMPDFALMSNGGTIMSIRCTQTYTRDSGNIYLFGFPLWNVESKPDVILKPGIMPGECWAFEGSEGYVVISFAMPIYVTGFTIEHTPKELTPYGNIKSAPYQFSVWALKEVMDKTPQFLGRFKFLDNGESLQYFDAEKLDVPVQMVELKIESNHGSINYTCLYRFRVHGTPA